MPKPTNSTPLSNAHICNSQHMLLRLLSALATTDSFEFRMDDILRPSYYLKSSSSITKRCIGAIFDLFRDFASKYQISTSIIKKHFHFLITNYPLIVAETLEFSSLSFTEKAYIAKTYLYSFAHIDRVAIIISRYVGSFPNSMEMKLLENPLEFPSSDYSFKRFSCYSFGPHLGVSFAHLSFVGEFKRVDQLSSSKAKDLILNYIEPDCKYVAYGNLKPDSLYQFTHITSMQDTLFSDHLALFYQGDTITRYQNLCRLTQKSIPCIVNNLSITQSAECNSSNFSDLYLYKGNSKGIFPAEVEEFIKNNPRIVGLHVRDSLYSGSGQSLRDASINNYGASVSWLISKGYGVIRFGTAGVPLFDAPVKHYLDLNNISISAHDQMQLLSKLEFLIGAASGITNFYCCCNIPTLIANTTVLPSTPFTTDILHSPKHINYMGNERISVDSIKILLTRSWAQLPANAFVIKELLESELLRDVKYFASNGSTKENWPTLHSILSYHGLELNMPDFHMAPRFQENITDLIISHA